MARGRPKNPQSNPETKKPGAHGATTGYEANLWRMADILRGSMDAAEYKHVVLGLIFLKYISDAFEERHARLEGERAQGADPEDPDEYRAENIFWVLPEARWVLLKAQAKQPTIGQLIDLISDIKVGDEAARSKDVLGRVYEYFLSQFASAEGKKGAIFKTNVTRFTSLREVPPQVLGNITEAHRLLPKPTG